MGSSMGTLGGAQRLDTYSVSGSTPGLAGVLGMLADGRGVSSHHLCPREETASRPRGPQRLRPQEGQDRWGPPCPR